jgi:VPDSG-CTERM motif
VKTMKNRSSKTILVFFALGLISCALCVQQAQAVPITGAITFAGGVELNTGTVNTATAVVTWLDEGGFMPTVQSASGSFAGLDGATATFAFPWVFGSGVPALWTVGGFTFDLIASHIVSQIGDGFLLVAGTGFITNGVDSTRANWLFSVQDDPANGVFSFSGSTQATPDSGATVALLGLALAGIEGIRRKLRRSKS